MAAIPDPNFISGQVKNAPPPPQDPPSNQPSADKAALDKIFGKKPESAAAAAAKAALASNIAFNVAAAKADEEAAVEMNEYTTVPGAIKCKLSDAKKLFQPVMGSDPKSTYFCVALSNDIKIAVRIKTNQKVSIRAEGIGLSIHKTALLAAGLNGDTGHYSVHLGCGSDDLARKAVGAVLFGTGIKFDQVATDLSGIWGKGQ
jgi:hypothetical protein